ncbi:hypothetical protein TRAPUB_3637 [Trametes pubescens]|uniref:Uncharacterized protein n=1 Tax=Trametes pubescens TaxID=154538 RepID=A0A1M2VD32_TRAPU|nr:hypothetical protein TRAPUB_3637 [Trametes pubescens]
MPLKAGGHLFRENAPVNAELDTARDEDDSPTLMPELFAALPRGSSCVSGRRRRAVVGGREN